MTIFPELNENSAPFELDYSSSVNFYTKLLQQVTEVTQLRRGLRQVRTDDQRQLDIITMHASGKTIDEIGKMFGVTRERIRQIERKIWLHIAQYKGRLKPLEALIVSILRKNGGFARVDEVAHSLRTRVHWSDREIRYLLSHFFEFLSEKFIFVGGDNEYVSLTDHICWTCPEFKETVKEMVEELEKRDESITLDQFAHRVRRRLEEVLPECKRCRSKMNEASTELFLWLFKNDPYLRAAQERLTVRRSTHFQGLNRAVLLVLKIAKRPMTKQQILSELKRMYPKQSFSIKQIQSTTSNSPQCYDKVFLWDRGGIRTETLYIHKNYIKTDLPILGKIEKVLIAIEKEGLVPQVRLNRIFNEHAEECIAQGIPNVYALFSSLKVRNCSRFTFQRSPYIGFKGNRQKISNAKILEDYVRSSDHPITRQEMRDYGRSLGLQDEHISNTIVLTNLVATREGYIYRDDAPEKAPAFQGMVNRLKTRLKTADSVSITDLFRQENAVCEELKIVDSKMLYSLLRRLNLPEFHLKYPIIHPAPRKKAARKKA